MYKKVPTTALDVGAGAPEQRDDVPYAHMPVPRCTRQIIAKPTRLIWSGTGKNAVLPRQVGAAC
eukprot:scaffold25490_cov74-Skeletonema_menzelii.AAC.1